MHRQTYHFVVMEKCNGQPRTLAIKMFYKPYNVLKHIFKKQFPYVTLDIYIVLFIEGENYLYPGGVSQYGF